ncbi:MAG: cytochrome ubiquinol oxidase subunit I [Elusimicrobia bacterium]|nr:cytochrome ubiquinol oxidase subunit I [Candidatus Obscuribacterium magneticum]
MDPVTLARVQFAGTIGFHYIFPPLSIGLACLIFIILSLQLITGNEFYRVMARFWIKLLALVFVTGVATGITMEFQFGTNWASYSRFVGDIFGAPLAAEGILAFSMESTFLGLLLFGENKISRRMYWFSALMVATGTVLSAFWIIVANSWQQTPAGFHIVNGRAELTDFWSAVFNPSTLPRFFHTIDAAVMTGAFFMLGVAALYLLKKRHMEFAKCSMKIALWIAFVSAVLQLPLGHLHAIQVADTQPVKLATFEGLFETQKNAPLLLFGVPDAEAKETRMGIRVPGLLSFLISGSRDTVVKGLNDFPRDEWPPLKLPFFSFHLMFILGVYLIGLSAWGMFLLKNKKLNGNILFLKLALFSVPVPFVTNQLGWIAAEVGRQPWVVMNILKTKDAISTTVPAGQIVFSILMFSVVYLLVFCAWIYLMKLKIKHGPEGA